MKQVLQSLKDGSTRIVDVPCPQLGKNDVLIKTSKTLISAGTERMLVGFGKAGWIDKARQQPEKVKQVLQKMKTDGVVPTVEAVFNKLDQPIPLGYCNVGTVLDTGAYVKGLEKGMRVVSNGYHAQVVSVGQNLVTAIPDNVSDEEASFTVLGAIGLQGIRLANPTLGESVVVMGLGLIGLMTVQLLKANGCRVLGMDFDPKKLKLAQQFGAEVLDLSSGVDPVAAGEKFSRGRGVDAVLITAATKSNEPVQNAARMSRKRGRIVLVGVTGLDLSRDDFYEKELSFQVSCSYGPGRYDASYEEQGVDYPIGHVRWTEGRNFEAVLDMMQSGALDVKALISHHYDMEDIPNAYELICSDEPSLGIVLDYPDVDTDILMRKTVKLADKPSLPTRVVLGVVGSGNYASSVLIPAFSKTSAKLHTIASSGGISGAVAGNKHGFDNTTTDTESVFADNEITTVLITTRHNSHADLVSKALKYGKHVFVEKPLALSHEGLDNIEAAYKNAPHAHLMVGFNRRFSPHIQKLKKVLDENSSAKSFVMSVNAGAIPSDHWTQDKSVGGGRIIGEACHFIDLLRYLAGAKITDYSIQYMNAANNDTASIQLKFEDGSIGAIHYFANGNKAIAKERLEVYQSGGIAVLDNFRKLTSYGFSGLKDFKTSRQDKGQKDCCAEFVRKIEKGENALIPFDELIEISRISIDLSQGRNSSDQTD